MNFKQRCTAFFKLLEEAAIKRTLENDKCKVVADRYNLVHVFILFSRAKFVKSDYTVRNFYLALYLAHDLEEDLDDFKDIILQDCLGRHRQFSRTYVKNFLQDRFKLFQKLKFKGRINKTVCSSIMKKAPHWAWKRIRDSQHAGVFYKNNTCATCKALLDLYD